MAGVLTSPFNLPAEVVQLILDQLSQETRLRDLFSLLTVNKFFFQASVRNLYADPVKSQKSWSLGRAQRAATKFAVFVARYSPALDDDVEALRQALHDQVIQLPAKPYVDYLSFIRSMSFDNFLFGPSSLLAHSLGLRNERPYRMRLYSTLLWAVCGHRLASMQHIVIPCRDLDRYVRHVDKMTSIKTIRLSLLDVPTVSLQDWTEEEKASTRADIETLINFTNHWSDAHDSESLKCKRPVDIQVVGCVDDEGWWSEQPYADLLRRVFSRMPISSTPTIDCCSRLEWARLVLAPETIDLASVKTLIARQRFDDEADLPWPAQSMSSILQQCQSLQRLDLTLRENDEDTFEWAAHQRRTNPALSNINLPKISALTLVISTGTTDPRPWKDALFAFGPTLKSINITDPQNYQCIDLCAFNDLPELESLSITANSFVNSHTAQPFAGCHKLRHLILENKTDSTKEQQASWSLATKLGMCGTALHQLQQETLSTTSHLKQPELAEYPNQQEYGPWNLSTLTTLSLCGSVVYQLHQETLSTASHLEQLELAEYSDWRDPSSPIFSWDANHWAPPALRELVLVGSPARAFKWTMLQSCPQLVKVTLTGSLGDVHPSALILNEDSESLLPSLPTIQDLTLEGWSIPDDILYGTFPRLFPNLVSFALHSCVDLSAKEQEKLSSLFSSLKCLQCEAFCDLGDLPDEDGDL